MSYAKQFPIRITLSIEDCDFLIEALKNNENDFEGYIAESAEALREKIERYGRHETNENGDEVVRLGFYEKEGEKFIWQFLAVSKMVMDLQIEIANYKQIDELNESIINKYQNLVELYEEDINDGETESVDGDLP